MKKVPYLLTPGPTPVPEDVRKILAEEVTNPDEDLDFLAEYLGVRNKLSILLNAGDHADIYIMPGEAIMGLEAAVANLVKSGDRVLVVDNGVYGSGFADLVRSYGGKPKKLGADWRRAVDIEALERELRSGKYDLVTLVHCDTPSAILNPLKKVAEVVKDYGALLIVDSVSSMGAVEIDVSRWKLDVVIGGSQKVFNLPPGLTIVTVSEEAWDKVEKVDYRGFYMNFRVWEESIDEKQEFPFTQTPQLVYALSHVLDGIIDEGIGKFYQRHEKAKRASWEILKALGLEPYPEGFEDASPTVTAFTPPEGVDEYSLWKKVLEEHGVMLGRSWGPLRGRVLRVGHMGVQASRFYLEKGFGALKSALENYGLEVEDIEDILDRYFPGEERQEGSGG